MFNLNELEIIKGADREANKFSFVGMLRESDGKTRFYLPQGFEEFPKDYNKIKQFFFRMYRVLRKFVADKRIQDLKYNDSNNQKGNLGNRDDLIIKEGGKVFEYHPPEESEPILIYSKISLLEGILDGYDELKIIALEKRHRQTTEIDYSKLHRYLEYATFLPDHTIYIDNMNLPKHTLTAESTSIVEMFCYLYQEIKIQLEDPVELLAQTLSQKFKEAHLHSRLSLFEGDSFQETHILLCEILAQINKLTIYKDEDYWHFYEAIEDFLYGNLSQEKSQDGIVWGMNNFSSVWEEMCQYYYWTNYSKDILYADTQINIAIKSKLHQSSNYGGQQIVIKKGFTNPFSLEIGKSDSPKSWGREGQPRWMRPDLIVEEIVDPFSEYIHDEPGRFPNSFSIKLEKLDTKDSLRMKIWNDFNSSVAKFYKPEKKNRKYQLKKTADGFSTREIEASKTKGWFPEIKGEYYQSWKEEEEKFLSAHRKCISTIIDFKYIDIGSYSSEKLKNDIVKQIVYNYALSQPRKKESNLQFIIPYYYESIRFDNFDIGISIPSSDLPEDLRTTGISVIKADFSKIMATYIGSMP